MIIGTAKRNKNDTKPTPTRVYSKKQETAVAKSVGGKVRNGNIIMVNSELYIPVWMVAQLGGYESAYISIIWE